MNVRKPRLDDEAGMSLVEVIVYLTLSVIVLTVLSAMFVSGLQSQASTKDRNTATGSAEVATNSLQTSLRNASVFTIDSTGTRLQARVAVGDSNSWECRAWVLTADKNLVYKAASTTIASPSGYSGWTTLASGVTGSLVSGSTHVPFVRSGSQLTYGFNVATGDSDVPVKGSVVPQAAGEGSPATCSW